MNSNENNPVDSQDADEDVSDADFSELAPSPWEEIKKMQYGGDRTFAHIIENWVLTAQVSERARLEKKLLGVLASPKLGLATKDFLCRMLAFAGSEACASALAPLLWDEKTSHFARMALEGIPGKKVDDVLAHALPKLKGDCKKGLFGTLAVRTSRKKEADSRLKSREGGVK